MLELKGKDVQIAIVNIFKDLKENIVKMSRQMGNLSKAMETIKKEPRWKFKNGKVKYLKLKFNCRLLTASWRLQKKD